MRFFLSKEADDKENNELNEFVIDDDFKVILNSRGLVPVIIQHEDTSEVIRLGYLDRWALEMSFDNRKVFLFRRSKQRLEVLGEDEDVEYKITTVKLSRNHRNLLFKVLPSKPQKIQSNFIHKVFSQKQD
jgi:phosphoribosyl-AMP cyclohydrolase